MAWVLRGCGLERQVRRGLLERLVRIRGVVVDDIDGVIDALEHFRQDVDLADQLILARSDANGEGYHYLRDKGFLIKVPAPWRELHARGLKLMRLGISAERWREIVEACGQRVVAFEIGEE